MYLIVYRYIYIYLSIYDILFIYRLIMIYMNTYIFIDIIYIFYLYSRDIYVSISLYNIHKFVYTHVDTPYTHSHTQISVWRLFGAERWTRVVTLYFLVLCVCVSMGMIKRKLFYSTGGGGGISFLSGPHAQS